LRHMRRSRYRGSPLTRARSQRPTMTISASSDLVWLAGRGRLLTPHHWWRPRTRPIRTAFGPAGLAAANAATGARIASAMIVFLMFSCCSPKFAGLTSWQGWRFRRTPQGRTLTPRRTHRHGPPVSRRLDQHRVTLPNHKPTQATRLGTPALTRSRSPGTRRPQHASRLSVLPSVRLLELL
jgi:hypothetical protein